MGENCLLSAVQMLELDFLDCRSRLLEVAAFLDRIDRYPDAELARSDFRYRAVIDLVEVIRSGRPQRTLEMLTLLSDPTPAPMADQLPPGKALGAWRHRDH